MTNLVVGICGPAGAGKDTVAGILKRTLGFQQTAWAFTLKQMLAVAGFPEPEDQSKKGDIIEGWDFSWRDAAQKLGTEWGRALDADIWVKIVKARIDQGLFVSPWCLSDTRFENEAETIRNRWGGFVLHVRGRAYDLGEANAKHASETGIRFVPGVDHAVDNGPGVTLAQLEEQVLRIVRPHMLEDWEAEHARDLALQEHRQ